MTLFGDHLELIVLGQNWFRGDIEKNQEDDRDN